MKIEFEDKSYIEITQSEASDIFVTIAALSASNANTLIVNSVKLSKEDFLKLVKSMNP